MSVLRETGGVLVVRCLHCGHEAGLSRQALARFGLKPDAPISTFVKRLRCSECGSGSVMAKRIAAPIAAPGRQKRRA
jgi:ribosomal protein S27E